MEDKAANLSLLQVAELVHDLRHQLLQVQPLLLKLAAEFRIPSDQTALSKLLRLNNGTLHEIEDLVLGAKYQNQQPTVALSDFNLFDFQQRLTGEFSPQITAAGISLQLDGLTKSQSIQADSQLLYRALSNLIYNALRYTAPGGAIRLQFTPGDSEDSFAVYNTAEPLPPDSLSSLMQPFRSDGSLRAGLGLSIVQSIAAAHGGRMQLTSDKSGNTFSIILPKKR